MATKSHRAWERELIEVITAIDGVERATFKDGERDFIAGQRDIDRMTFTVELTEERIQRIEFEEGAYEDDPFTESLNEILNELELDLGMSPGDTWLTWDKLGRGQLFVTAENDRRLAGSL